MKKLNFFLAALFVALLFGCETQNSKDEVSVEELNPTNNDVIEGQYIVTFEDDFIPSGRKGEPIFTDRNAKQAYSARKSTAALKKMNAFFSELHISQEKISQKYTAALSGFAAELTDAEVEALRSNPKVRSVEPDRMVYMEEFWVESIEPAEVKGGTKDATAAREVVCAVSNAGGAGNGAGKDTWVWVVDSGIDLDHPDLNVVTNTSYAKSFVGGSANDCNGHGTHVAGIAAAVNNSIGVTGVSAGASVVPVRVFGCNGGSSASTILGGINHVAANDISGDVMNLSLGGYYGSGCSSGSSYISAINNVAGGGTKIAIAAGNSSANANYYQPACINRSNVYTVASMTCGGSFSSF